MLNFLNKCDDKQRRGDNYWAEDSTIRRLLEPAVQELSPLPCPSSQKLSTDLIFSRVIRQDGESGDDDGLL